jgi:hypothetical protein
MAKLNAEKLTLNEVHHLLDLAPSYDGSFNGRLTFEPLSPYEIQELTQIWQDFAAYLNAGTVLEKLVKVLSVLPLLRLAGFYRVPVSLVIEESIAQIQVEEEETVITGRFDLLAINSSIVSEGKPFWLLVVESKNSALAPNVGLPQLLTYASQSLAYQNSVWGLVTNGISYDFVYLEQGNPNVYQLLPPLNLFVKPQAQQLLQVLKAICRLQKNPVTPAIAA